ncbi:MAG: tetratricopeptide repeat protein [Acidobacteria bacterium]|nr:tetratricopeptide repeat protein [Acidobacteriota bacterium]
MGGFSGIIRSLGQSTGQRAIARALTLFSKGDLAKAIDVLKEAHARSPEDNEVLFELTPMLTLAGRGQEAGETLRKILRRNKDALQRVTEMIEQTRMQRANVAVLHDAVADHFIKQGDLNSAAACMARTGNESLKGLMIRHQSRWDSVRNGAPDAKMTKPSLHAAYYLALAHEQLREYTPAAEIYRTLARVNPEELERVLDRLETLLNRDYQNAALRVAVGALFLQAGRPEDAKGQFQTALDTDRACAPSMVQNLEAHLAEALDDPAGLRWVLALAHLASGARDRSLEDMRHLIEAGLCLEEVCQLLHGLAAKDDGLPARRLLARALIRRQQYQAALETLLQLAEEDGLSSIRESLELLAAAQPDVPRIQLLLADSHLAEGCVDEAVHCMRRAREAAPAEDVLMIPKVTSLLEKHPESAGAHLLLADMQYDAGEIDRAVVVLRHLVREAPDGAPGALDGLTGIIGKAPGLPHARIGAAEACLALKQYPQALEHLEAVAAARPDLTAEFLHTIGLLAESAPDLYPNIESLLRNLEPRSPLPCAVRFALGDAAFHGGDPAASTAALRDLLESAPERMEEIRLALERLDRADPRAVEVPYLLALIHLDRRDHEAALMELSSGGAVNVALLDRIFARYEQILSEGPNEGAVRCGFIQALFLGRRYDQVLSMGEEALRTLDDVRVGRVMMLMGDASREKGDRDNATKRYFAAHSRDRTLVREIIERLDQLIQDEGTHPLASLALGKVMATEGRAAEARTAFAAAYHADPKLRDTVLTELRGLMASCHGDPETGLMTLTLLLEVRDMHQALQIASTLLNEHPEHASHVAGPLETIVKERPDEARAHFELGRALQHLGFHARSAGSFLNAFRRDAALSASVQRRLQESQKEAPTIAEPYLAASAIHATRSKHQAAADVLARALEANPALAGKLLPRLEEISKQARGNARVSSVFAAACLRAGNHESAVEAYGESARADAELSSTALSGLNLIITARPDLGIAYLERGRIHASRLQIEEARADLDRAFSLVPQMIAEILEVAEQLRSQAPESAPGALLVADLYIAARRERDATKLLEEACERQLSKPERLAMTVRLWRLDLARHDDETARQHLEQALTLAPDRNQFLERVHQVQVASLRTEAAIMRQRFEDGSRRSSDLERCVRALIDLGRLDEASAEIRRCSEIFTPEVALRLDAELALRRGDYPRAYENLRSLGPSTLLAFGAERAGEHAAAAMTLESLAASTDDPALRTSLERVYRAMVVSDLMGGGRRLQAETILTFGEGKAA